MGQAEIEFFQKGQVRLICLLKFSGPTRADADPRILSTGRKKFSTRVGSKVGKILFKGSGFELKGKWARY